VTLTLTLDPAIRHTVVHHSSTSTYTPNFIQIEETFCGRTDRRTDGRTDGHFSPSLILLGRLLEVDLIMLSACVVLLPFPNAITLSFNHLLKAGLIISDICRLKQRYNALCNKEQ